MVHDRSFLILGCDTCDIRGKVLRIGPLMMLIGKVSLIQILTPQHTFRIESG